KQHMRCKRVPTVPNLVMDPEYGLTEYSRNGSTQLQRWAKNLRFPDQTGNAHFHFARYGVGLNNGRYFGRYIAGLSMQSSFTIGIHFRPTDMGKAAGRKQPPTKIPKPIGTPVGKVLRCPYPTMTYPCQAMLIKKGVNDIHPTFDHDFIPNPSTRIDPGNACS